MLCSAHKFYYAIEQYLLQNGVEILFGYECTNLVLEGAVCRGVRITNGREELEIQAAHTVIATFSVPKWRIGQSTSFNPARMARLRIALTSSVLPRPSTWLSAPNSR